MVHLLQGSKYPLLDDQHSKLPKHAVFRLTVVVFKFKSLAEKISSLVIVDEGSILVTNNSIAKHTAMADNDSQEEHYEDGEEVTEQASEAEDEEDQEQAEVKELTAEEVGNSLDMLGRTANGIDFAFIRCQIPERELTDINAISPFQHLQIVDVSSNSLSSLAPLNKLPCLISINAADNRLKSLDLGNFKYLQRLLLSGNKLKSIPTLECPLLEHLDVSNNQIKTWTSLNSFSSLLRLDVAENRIQQVADLHLPKLQQLDVSGNEVSGLDALTGIPALESLSATGCHLESIEGLPQLKQLKMLNISDNNISSLKQLQHLASLKNLNTLTCRDNPMADEGDYRVEALVALPQLETLDGEGYEAEDREEAATVCHPRIWQQAGSDMIRCSYERSERKLNLAMPLKSKRA
eukprot:m.172301 g.172301  ORF g.172301 m.172301 type:complete len:407 (-) comp16715_c0_seq5:1239-2459(-)